MNNINLHYTSVSGKTSYTYVSVTGEKTVIIPDENTGVTLDFIHVLHSEENREVYNNRKQAKRPLSKREKADIEAWRSDEDHPERGSKDYPARFHPWHLPFDSLWAQDGTNAMDADPAMYHACQGATSDTPAQVERLRDFVMTLSPRQQELYRLTYIEGYPLKDAARKMGITQQRASTLHKQIKKNIEKNFPIKP